MTNEEKIIEQLLPTWQPLAAIAFRAGIPMKEAQDILLKMHDQGELQLSRVKLDPQYKNKVLFFRKKIKKSNQEGK